MSTLTNIGSIITGLLSNPATVAQGTSMLNSLSSQATVNAQISNLLVQLQQNPTEAGTIAATIASMPNVPANISGMVDELPAVAGDKVQLAVMIAQIQAALPHSSLFG